MAENAAIGPGTYIAHGVYVGPNVFIGRHCIVGRNVLLAHDCVIGDFCNIGAGAQLSEGAVLDEGVQLGMGAIIAPNRRVGAWSTVMMNSAVVDDVPERVRCSGVPAVVASDPLSAPIMVPELW